MEYVRVHLIDLPCGVHGFTIMVDYDSFDMYINAKLNPELQCTTYDHEINHINNGDFDKMYNINELESLRHAV